jgi:alanine racemase
LIDEASRLPGIEIAGLYTHYASVEDDAEFSRSQRTQFRQLHQSLLKEGRKFEFLHANNSGALLLERASIFNTVRPGLLVYGVAPPGTRPTASTLKSHLRPALTWKCRIGLVKQVRKGTPLSYGRAYIAPRSPRAATLTDGYADGYLRSGSNRTEVLIGGQRCPILGRITMDQMLADVSALPQPRAGDEVVLIGHQDQQTITCNELAQWCGTVPWEILTNITYRVPRLYRGASAA